MQQQQAIEEPTDAQLQSMRIYEEQKQDLLDLIDNIPGTELSLLEIGSYAGESAVIFAESGKFKKIVCIDPWMSDSNADGQKNHYGWMDRVEKLFDANASRFPDTIHKYKGTLYSFIIDEKFVEHSFDLIYIDGLHTYAGCKSDILLAKGFIKPKLAYAGHDYTDEISHVAGVKQAVDEMFGTPDYVFCDNSWIKYR